MTQQPIKSNPLYNKFKEALNIQDSMRVSDNPFIVSCIEIAEAYAASKQVGEENRRLRKAAKELLHLHSCEQEGLQSGKPTFEMWFNAVNKLSEALDGDAGNKEETKT